MDRPASGIKKIIWTSMTSEKFEFKMEERINWMFWGLKKLKRRKQLEDREAQSKMI